MPPFPELKDISPPTPPPFSAPEEVQALVWQVFGAVAALMLMVALWLWWRSRVRRAKAPPLPQPALDQLRSRLTALQPLAPTLEPTALGQQVGDAIRTYLQREHGLLARYRTTEELFGTSRGPRRDDAPPPLPFLQPFEDVFARCDALKFAGPDTTGAQRSGLIDRALAATDEVRIALAPRPIPPASPPPLPPLPAPPVAIAPLTTEDTTTGPAFALQPQTPAAAPSKASPPPSAFAIGAPAPLSTLPPLTVADPTPLGPSRSTGPDLKPACHGSDAFTHPQTAAFARGADVIPA